MSPDAYPAAPGHRGGDTDREAAAAVAMSARTFEAKALAHITVRPRTADEVHAAIEAELRHAVPLYSIRPRLSALVAKGLAIDSGERRLSAAGRCRARVYRATTAEERALHAVRKAAEVGHG